MRIGIIGCGLIGQKRAKALSDGRLVACADASQERAEALARAFPGCKPFSDGRALLECKDIDLVIVATPHDSLEEMTRAAVSFGKHVLVEKPAARSAQELDSVMEEAKKCRSLVRVGFNHRYLSDAIDSVESKTVFLGLNDETKPAVVKDENNPTFVSIIMPLRI